jgi:hypothetical protein
MRGIKAARLLALLSVSASVWSCANDLTTEPGQIGATTHVQVARDTDRSTTSVDLPIGVTTRFVLVQYGTNGSVVGSADWQIRNLAVASKVDVQPTDLGLTAKGASVGETYIVGTLTGVGATFKDSIKVRVIAP